MPTQKTLNVEVAFHHWLLDRRVSSCVHKHKAEFLFYPCKL